VSALGNAARAISWPVLIGSVGMAAITLYEGRGIGTALFVLVAWYLFVQLIIWIASKVRSYFGARPSN
jgi:hypothetical protein